MLLNRPYLPEGRNESYRKNAEALLTVSDAKKMFSEETPLEMTVARCDAEHDLYGTIGPFPAVIRRSEAISAAVSGAEKENRRIVPGRQNRMLHDPGHMQQ